MNITADYNQNGKHIGYTAIRKDISKQKELEEKLTELEKKSSKPKTKPTAN